MKKSLILVVSLILFSCTREDIQDLPTNDAESTFVTEAMAIAQVEEFVSQLDLETKGISKKISSIYSTGDSDYTKANENGYQSPFVYVVNFADDMGFALVSGDTRMPPILAMIDNGPPDFRMYLPEIIKENYKNPVFGLDQVTDEISVSPAYFSTTFKKETGKSFVQYLTNVRLEKAKELLKNTDAKTYEIAEKVGFSEPNYFSFIFKKNIGLSPSQYRAKNR